MPGFEPFSESIHAIPPGEKFGTKNDPPDDTPISEKRSYRLHHIIGRDP